MYKWYQTAQICYVYLSDVGSLRYDDASVKDELTRSAWFTRGWTLQELIAPRMLEFRDSDWEVLGSRSTMALDLSRITGITYDVFSKGFYHKNSTVAQIMSWISCRQTSRIEDMSYSILGLFDINMSLLYGEGSNAFLRLQQEIVKKTDDMSIFAWETRETTEHRKVGISKMFAPGPECFSHSSCATRYTEQDRRAFGSLKHAYGIALDFLSKTTYVVTNKGLQVSGYCCNISGLQLGLSLPHPSAGSRGDKLLILACGSHKGGHVLYERGDFVAVPIYLTPPPMDHPNSSIQKDRPRSGSRHGNIMFLDSQKVFDNLAKLEKLDVYLEI
jgi:hypothetical protein